MQDASEVREWFTIDRIEADGKRVYGCGVRTREKALGYLADVMAGSAERSDARWYRLRSLGVRSFAEACEAADEPELMPLGRLPRTITEQ